MKHEVFFLTNVFSCISFININRGTLKNIRESLSTSLSSIFGKQQTRGRYISEGYLYFLSYYSRSYQNLFSDDPVQIKSLKNVRGSNYTETLSSRIFIYSFLKAKHNLSVKNVFSHVMECTQLYFGCSVFTVRGMHSLVQERMAIRS